MTPRPPLVLVGPTASGKSATALALARHRRSVPGARPVELVSCDAFQVYREMEVGTGAPSPAEREEVPHHLVGTVDPGQEFHVAAFRAAVAVALAEVAARGAEAVLVGGTGLYVRAVVDDLRIPGRYPEALAALEALPTGELARRLVAADPVAASRIPPGNRRRLLRALEVTEGSGRPFSASGPGLGEYPPRPFVQVGLRVPREDLEGRIHRRVLDQVAAGWPAEVERLSQRPGGWSRTAQVALGYAELAEHLAGAVTLDEAVGSIVRRTRRFAVRQERWFRRDPRIRWVDAPAGGRSAGQVAAELDRWWAESAVAPAGAATTVPGTGGAAPAGPPPPSTSSADGPCSD